MCVSRQRPCSVIHICQQIPLLSCTLNQACEQGSPAQIRKHPSICNCRYARSWICILMLMLQVHAILAARMWGIKPYTSAGVHGWQRLDKGL